ncbi:MAG: transglycosylase SLT domain-containing protein [Deltaproteobacteria bacterium]|nr:transglycosylase SLT domain-containing protein [Deltaproteobacteria bacterium]MBW2052052.1 transglycosylase SLT domain-containing protein [Deltaproteobacteria bacterium]MBW2142001.1 transglycosylase SLT domain-containing protein [Deltaproteobacteria bacterium]MBW2322092.1 transglycosylase SLT domain-containing protein [Deltaproteobacteria bacterium]
MGNFTLVFACEPQKTITSIPSQSQISSNSLPQYVTWKDFERAVQLYHDGHLLKADKLLKRIYRLKLTARQNRLVRFLRGVIASRLDHQGMALRMFSTKLGVLSALDDHVLFYRARAWFGLGNWNKALSLSESYIRLYPEGSLSYRVRLLKADCLTRQGLTDRAIKEYRTLIHQCERGEVYLGLARLYEKQGRTDTARDVYLKAIQRSRSSTVRLEAFSKYKELLKMSLAREGNEELYLEMVRLLLQEWRLTEALTLLEQAEVQGGTPEYLDELAVEKGRTLIYLNRLDQAREHCRLAALSATKEYKAELLGMYARCLRDQGLFEESARACILSGEAATAKNEADSAFFKAGVNFLKADKKAQAEQVWRRIRARVRKRSLADDILWHSAWYYYRHKSWNAAADRFMSLSRKYPGRACGLAARYWLARILERTGRQSEAKEHYLKLAVKQGQDYYRILSLERLQSIQPQGRWQVHPGASDLRIPDGIKIASAFVEASSLSSSDNNPALCDIEKNIAENDLFAERARIMGLNPVAHASSKFNLALVRVKNLAAAGALDLAFKETEHVQGLLLAERKRNAASLSKIQKKERNRALKRIQDRFFAFSSAYLAKAGDFYQFVKLQDRHQPQLNASSQVQKYRARRRLYPLSYLEHAHREAKNYGLDPALILAIIRAESYYNPQITSYSNAIGLMQILPSTGRTIARHINLPSFKVDDLFEPEANISLGTWYLAALLKEFNGQVPLALAAYNAGPFNAKRWIKQSGNVDLEEFIDQIPFDQTRRYVKKILAYYYIYHLLYSGETLDLELKKPLAKNHLNLIDF